MHRSDLIITEEPYPPYVALLKRQKITRKNKSGNYQPGELAPLTNSNPVSLAEQMRVS